MFVSESEVHVAKHAVFLTGIMSRNAERDGIRIAVGLLRVGVLSDAACLSVCLSGLSAMILPAKGPKRDEIRATNSTGCRVCSVDTLYHQTDFHYLVILK